LGKGKCTGKLSGVDRGLAQQVGRDATNDYTQAAQQHHENTLAHDLDRATDIHLHQHEDNEDRQAVNAQEVIGGALERNQAKVRQQYRCCINKDERRQVVEHFPLAFLFQPEPETDHADQHGHDARRRRNQGIADDVIHRGSRI
jgi:hypothetical protein